MWGAAIPGGLAPTGLGAGLMLAAGIGGCARHRWERAIGSGWRQSRGSLLPRAGLTGRAVGRRMRAELCEA